jgi:hypothetical protein
VAFCARVNGLDFSRQASNVNTTADAINTDRRTKYFEGGGNLYITTFRESVGCKRTVVDPEQYQQRRIDGRERPGFQTNDDPYYQHRNIPSVELQAQRRKFPVALAYELRDLQCLSTNLSTALFLFGFARRNRYENTTPAAKAAP